ncbi:MAG: helix-turn-helix domain-containing protein [Hyphomicrobiaceae bacterium]|nr:helix-turn-helix domain-containing protein [Hyphomicrobiaceae bacterium]
MAPMLALMTPSENVARDTDVGVRRPAAADSALGSPMQAGSLQVSEAREDIFLDGDDARNVFEVLDGIVCAYRILPDGERHIVSFYYPGDVIGHCSLGTYSYSAQALTPVRLRRVPRSIIERSMAQRPELAQRFLRLAALELAATRDHLVCLAAKSAEAKVAAFLMALSRRNAAVGEDPGRIKLPMTRLDIADYLGLTIETVSRMLSKFKRKGFIDLPRATLVVLKDMRGLATLADA